MRKPSYEELYRQVTEFENERERLRLKYAAKNRKCRARYDAMLDTVDAYMCLVDRNLRIIWANEKAKKIFGGDLVNRHCCVTCHGRKKICLESSYCIVRQSFRGETVRYPGTITVSKNGRKIYFNVMARVVSRDADGRPCNVVKVYNDITQYKQVEEELKASMLQLRDNLSGTIKAMAMTVETRDPYTAGHQRRTADIARGIAQEMGLPREQVDGIRMAGAIHDLGKISVPAEILSKPGRIGAMEFSLIQQHPSTGYDILKGIDFKWPVAEIVRQHHERMDGSGYPFGYSGNQILLEARIIAVADVIEAMSSHRPYRPALGLDKAFAEIKQHRGTLYDENAVDAAVNLFDKKADIFH